MSPQQCQESSPDRVTLHSLMTKPIQRFPQFILLLQVRLPPCLPVLVDGRLSALLPPSRVTYVRMGLVVAGWGREGRL